MMRWYRRKLTDGTTVGLDRDFRAGGLHIPLRGGSRDSAWRRGATRSDRECGPGGSHG